jgi:hypothetical protein
LLPGLSADALVNVTTVGCPDGLADSTTSRLEHELSQAIDIPENEVNDTTGTLSRARNDAT